MMMIMNELYPFLLNCLFRSNIRQHMQKYIFSQILLNNLIKRTWSTGVSVARPAPLPWSFTTSRRPVAAPCLISQAL